MLTSSWLALVLALPQGQPSAPWWELIFPLHRQYVGRGSIRDLHGRPVLKPDFHRRGAVLRNSHGEWFLHRAGQRRHCYRCNYGERDLQFGNWHSLQRPAVLRWNGRNPWPRRQSDDVDEHKFTGRHRQANECDSTHSNNLSSKWQHLGSFIRGRPFGAGNILLRVFRCAPINAAC